MYFHCFLFDGISYQTETQNDYSNIQKFFQSYGIPTNTVCGMQLKRHPSNFCPFDGHMILLAKILYFLASHKDKQLKYWNYSKWFEWFLKKDKKMALKRIFSVYRNKNDFLSNILGIPTLLIIRRADRLLYKCAKKVSMKQLCWVWTIL